ncbi:uncharacterized protein LOC132565429 [Ylistrum balloti]|uniref:uncharacterized protein LOC132565429 n=1 Tax=Ylistrum balloti TaxID=509963 RepID=UPI0029058D48|nr:uncharacterized protein LOC132565429 [Ylistrum balloti]
MKISMFLSLLVITLATVISIVIITFYLINEDHRIIQPVPPSKWERFFPFSQKRKHVVHAQPFDVATLEQNINKSFDYKQLMADINNAKVDQADPHLVQLIREYYIEPPSLEPYNLDKPDKLEYSNGQTPVVDSRLNYIEGGFYIECGGLDGEKGSNTLFFEKVRKWNGLLIEGDPSNYAMLKSKHRKAFTMNACLYPYTYPARVNYHQGFNLGRIIHESSVSAWSKRKGVKAVPIEVQCFPLYSILLAINRTTVDFFSLDIEGDELGVLKTIPFHKVDIRMLAVEFSHGPSGYSGMQRYMERNGYETILKVSRDDWGVNDLIFKKKEHQR